MSETEKKLSDYLETIGFSHSVEYKGEQTRDKWQCDAWLFTIKNQEFNYYTGLGHRRLSDYDRKMTERDFPLPRNPQTVYYRSYLAALEKVKKPVVPHIVGLLYSIITDGMACDMSFEDWCSDLGYDTDSRKALETYLLCQSNSAKYKKIFTHEQRVIIEEMLQDY